MSKKGANIETQLRRKYFRAKIRNDHENNRLNCRLRDLHKETILTLEGHWKDTKEVVDIFNNCQRTSGISPMGLESQSSELQEDIPDLHSKLTPWAYFGNYNIDTWQKRVDDDIPRPQTSHGRDKKSNLNSPLPRRPKTSVGLISPERSSTAKSNGFKRLSSAASDVKSSSGSSRGRPVSAMTERPGSQAAADQRRRQLAQLHAQAATITKNKFLDITASGPIYNRNLQFRKEMLEKSRGSPGEVDMHITQSPAKPHDEKLPQPDRSRPPTQSGVINANKLGVLQEEYESDDTSDGLAWDIKCMREQLGIKVKSHPNPSAVATHVTKDVSQKAPVKNVKDQRSSFGQSLASSRGKASIRGAPNQPQGYSDSSDDECTDSLYDDAPIRKETDIEVVSREMSRLTGVNLKMNRKYQDPRFYVHPHQRHKNEELFLRNRYTLLQRQIASNSPTLQDLGQKAVQINPSFNRTARLKVLDMLAGANVQKQKSKRRNAADISVQFKVDRFLENLAKFVDEERQADKLLPLDRLTRLEGHIKY